ncbi:hypothetical protein Q7P37_005147 [Cladosporium fusiforme]
MYNPRHTPGMEGAHNNHHSPMQASARAYTPAEQHQRNRSGSHNGVPLSPGHYRSGPTSPSASRPPRPSSPSARDRGSGFYDPISEGRSSAREVNSTPYQPRSPVHSRASYDQPASAYTNGKHPEHTPISRPAPPASPSHGHPPPSTDIRSPKGAYDPARPNGMRSHTPSQDSASALPPPPPPVRSSNPMSMMNLLSDDTSSAPARAPTPPATSAPKQSPVQPASRKSSASNKIKEETPAAPRSRKSSHTDREPKMAPPVAPQPQQTPRAPPVPVQTGPPTLTIRDTERAFAEIDALDLSDTEGDAELFAKDKDEYHQKANKRALEIQVAESQKRKRRRVTLMQKWHDQFSAAAEADRAAYVEVHKNEVEQEVRLKEVEEDKERKKDQQRKRRREKAIADEKIKRDEAIQNLAEVQDDEEKVRIQREIDRANKKIRDTEWRLQGITPTKELRNESPHNQAALGRREKEVLMEGGLMTSFHSSRSVGEDGTPEFVASGRGRGRGGRGGAGAGRARKSKEQKQAEKENAARAQMYLDQGEELPPLAPKEEEIEAAWRSTFLRARRLGRCERNDTCSSRNPANCWSDWNGQITRDISKAIPKVVRIKNNSLDTKASNARKTAQLAAKEARRWQLRTNKSTKDVAARAKRAMREMMGFWKRNERDEREGRKVAERQELDKAKKAEADREANRQKRKLNFLISQTELYSHFIGKKVKTDEIEKHGTGEGDGVATSGQTTTENPNAEHTVDLPESDATVRQKVTNFDELDFDAEDETELKNAAMANAQHAIQEAKDRAKAFDKKPEDDEQADGPTEFDDEGEMNFQNPTSLTTMDVAQPKMLSCQLKEYQVKGLNWLVNLYEQGINGILADEMGLGKTVQSISVMAYLAEMHNIWGPFLVIAPASTLHNWQQEIAKFVPNLKVLPYWGSAKDRKILRKFWDRKHVTYTKDSPFHVLVTSYQIVVADTPYFQKVKWQYMILDEAQAIKSSQSSRWKALLGFHCRNRLLLTGTPIQNNMQELWALLHFIMPSLFDNHDEFSEWFSKDIENHAQSNSKLNEDQLRRLHMILKPFMLRRIKKHVQKELGDKIEEDVYCDLTYRQRAMYTKLRDRISILDLIEKAANGQDEDTANLMNLVMQFRKVCNHPDLFERADVWSPLSTSKYADTASFMREGFNINVSYSVRSLVELWMPNMLMEDAGRLDLPGPETPKLESERKNGAFSFLRFVDQSASDVEQAANKPLIERVTELPAENDDRMSKFKIAYDNYDDEEKENVGFTPVHAMLNIVQRNDRKPLAKIASEGLMASLLNVTQNTMSTTGYDTIETCYLPRSTAPPAELVCSSQHALQEKETTFFNIALRRALYPMDLPTEEALLKSKLPPAKFPTTNMLPAPPSRKQGYTDIRVPSMRRFVTDSGKLAQLDRLLRKLKEGGHRVLLYFQMTRMIDLMEEYLTYRNYKYCRLDGSTKLEDRRDTVAAFQSTPEIFVFLLSTRAGGLGINLTSADTVIFYDSDWNPTIDSQAMDRAHRLGQTRQVTVYRLITRGTIEERIRKRALQKEEVQRVVITGQAGAGVDFNNRSTRENNRTKDIAMWLADDDQAAAIEQREAELAEQEAREGGGKKKRKAPVAKKNKEVSMDDMYHEGEGQFDDASADPSGAATPLTDGPGAPSAKKQRKNAAGLTKKAKTVKQRLAVIDGDV